MVKSYYAHIVQLVKCVQASNCVFCNKIVCRDILFLNYYFVYCSLIDLNVCASELDLKELLEAVLIANFAEKWLCLLDLLLCLRIE